MCTILVLEDDPSNREVVAAVLRSDGHIVLQASTGRAALEVCYQHASPIELMISDVTLPDLSGRVVALRSRKVHPELAVLFVSGTPVAGWSEDDRRNFSILGPRTADFLEKPFSPSVLAEKVRNLITRPGLPSVHH
jgi:two-component system cell cycle sensor histidine kinase/response regulator CckA